MRPVKYGVVPAGGLGTRFLPITRSVPKELLPLVDTAVIELVVSELAASGVERVVIVVAPFTDVVEQQGEHDQLRSRQLVEDVAEPLALGHVGRRQPFEVADGQQRVLVDRVLVIEVAHDAPRDLLELGEHPPQQAAIVHLRQPIVESGARPKERHQGLALGVAREEIGGPVAVEGEGVTPGRDGLWQAAVLLALFLKASEQPADIFEALSVKEGFSLRVT